MGLCNQQQHRGRYNLKIYSVFVLIYTICTIKSIQSCSPPRSKFGEQSVEQLSELGRSDKAEIIVLGTVISMYPDKRIQSMMVDIAVHMVLKSKKRMTRIIKVSGFENGGRNNRNTLFVHQGSTDCVTTEVNLYGTYVFFLRTNRNNEYSVDEINFQPAVTEIPCNMKLRKDFKRLIKKYRKARHNKSQCNDFANSKSNTSRKCLKHRYFTKLLNGFKYKLLSIRKYYCSIKEAAVKERQKRKEERRNRKNRKKEYQMRDIIRTPDNNNKDNKKTTTSTSSLFVVNKVVNNMVENDIVKPTDGKKQTTTNVIHYSKNENYIIHPNRNRHLNIKLRNWRLFNGGTRTFSSSAAASMKATSNSKRHFALLLFIVFMTSLACLY